MKNRSKILGFLTFFVIACCFFFNDTTVYASSPTDKINNYIVEITPNEDSTLNIKYHIEWEVLESDNAGELTWVKIGAPNKHYCNPIPLTDNIDNLKLNTSGGTYINVYFKDSYVKGDIVTFEYSITQPYMYTMQTPTENLVTYEFTPGWFNDMKIDHLEVHWNDMNFHSVGDGGFQEDNHFVWEKDNLEFGEKMTISVVYENDAFDFSKEMSSSNIKDDDVIEVVCIVLAVIFAILIGVGIGVVEDNYLGGSGFGRNYIYSSSRSSSSCVSSCACACACACAGGGRAGCSTKDFYHTNLKLEQLNPKKK